MNNLSVHWDDFILSFSAALDLLSPEIVEHHFDVAYITTMLLQELKLDQVMIRSATQAALLHDVGIFSLQERRDSFSFEFEEESIHAELGAQLLTGYDRLNETAHIIRYHHSRHEVYRYDPTIPFQSEALYLADRISVLIDKKGSILKDRKSILETIKKLKGSYFNPLLVDAFESLAYKESFWLDLLHNQKTIVKDVLSEAIIQLTFDDLMTMSSLFAQTIDFKSRYTAAHSRGVGMVAKRLAELAHYSDDEQKMLHFAGTVHDLGKVIIPKEILDKPSVVTMTEMEIIRAHPYYTKQILKSMNGMGVYTDIAAQHHERIDATGYPRRIGGESLCRESRLIAASDVFTALTEDRAYRDSLKPSKVREALSYFVQNNYLDPNWVEYIIDHQAYLTQENKLCQEKACEEYEMLYDAIQNVKKQMKS